MVDAARQMLDELMGRNRNLHPSEAGAKVNWEDPEFCQFYNVKFCPHDLFINTRADLGPCTRIHDEEAKHLYEETRPSQRKRQYEDEFLRFCNVMLHDVDRKIQKGKQRLQLMQPVAPAPLSRHQEQLANLTARINKLLSEAEEAGIRGDVDQAQDLMTLCEELKDEREQLVQQYEASHKANNSNTSSLQQSSGDEQHPQPQPLPRSPDENSNDGGPAKEEPQSIGQPATAAAAGSDEAIEAVATSASDSVPGGSVIAEEGSDGAAPAPATPSSSEDKPERPTEPKSAAGWSHEALPEKQMKVCEICGAFLIVGDAQQRIEDHLMGKQHLGYSKLRNAVAEINEARQKEREQEDRRRREGRVQRFHTYDNRRDSRNDYRESRSRDYGQNRQPSDRRHHHHKSHHSSHHSYSRSGGGGGGSAGGNGGGGGGGNRNNRHHNHNHSHSHYHRHDSRERHCRSRSRSRY